MIIRYHKNRSKKIIGLLHYKSGYSYFIESNIFDKVVLKKSSKELYENYKDWYKFSFIRCPFDRLLSFYKDKILLNPTNRINRNTSKLQVCQKIILKSLKKPLDLKEFENITFNQVCLVLHKNVYSDSHFLPYNLGLIYENKIIVDFIGKLENFTNDIELINNKLNLKLKYKKENSTFETNIFNYYNLKTIFTVAKVYEDDLKYFYPKVYNQFLDFEVEYFDTKKLINTDTIDVNIGIDLENNKSQIKKINNSFLNLFINYNNNDYEKYKLLLV